jgi:arginine/serine-rich splicing factor 17
MKAHVSGMKTFSFGQGLSFEGYVQFKEYICFVKAMDALRGMKLLHKEGDKAHTASIKVVIFINRLCLHVNTFKPYCI